MSFFGFGQSADIEYQLDGMDSRKMAEIKTEDGKKEKYYLYYDGESVSGKVNIALRKAGNRLEHQGIKIEFIGQIELYYDRGNHHEFTSLVKELARPGELIHNTSFDFEFNQVEKPYESYSGCNVRLRYFLRVTIVRRLSDVVKEMELIVHTLSSYPEMNNSIKMEVGIEDSLHIEFEYNKSKYHLKDVIVGKIYFLLVRIKIKHMEIAIMKRETTGSGPNTFNESEKIANYEIMDGAPVRGESIPIRVFLAGYDLAPTMRDINKKFSVRFYLNLVLVDEEERRYFKQQEITLWRKGERVRRAVPQQVAMASSAAALGAAPSAQSQMRADKFAQPTRPYEDESPTLTTATQQPPSPQQSQSPMQEEAPPGPTTAVGFTTAAVRTAAVASTPMIAPVISAFSDKDEEAPLPNDSPLVVCESSEEVKTAEEQKTAEEGIEEAQASNETAKLSETIAEVPSVLTESPPPLPTQEQEDEFCADLPTPPDEPLSAEGLEEEDEFVEALSTSSVPEEGESRKTTAAPVAVAQ